MGYFFQNWRSIRKVSTPSQSFPKGLVSHPSSLQSQPSNKQGTSWQASGYLPDYLAAELGHTHFSTLAFLSHGQGHKSQPSDKTTLASNCVSEHKQTCMRFSTSSRNAQFPRLFLRAFQKWTNSRFILTARSKLSKTSCAQQNHATTMQNGMKSRVLFSHTTAMSQTCAKLKENSKQSASSFKLLRVCCRQLVTTQTQNKTPKTLLACRRRLPHHCR